MLCLPRLTLLSISRAAIPVNNLLLLIILFFFLNFWPTKRCVRLQIYSFVFALCSYLSILFASGIGGLDIIKPEKLYVSNQI